MQLIFARLACKSLPDFDGVEHGLGEFELLSPRPAGPLAEKVGGPLLVERVVRLGSLEGAQSGRPLVGVDGQHLICGVATFENSPWYVFQ